MKIRRPVRWRKAPTANSRIVTLSKMERLVHTGLGVFPAGPTTESRDARPNGHSRPKHWFLRLTRALAPWLLSRVSAAERCLTRWRADTFAKAQQGLHLVENRLYLCPANGILSCVHRGWTEGREPTSISREPGLSNGTMPRATVPAKLIRQIDRGAATRVADHGMRAWLATFAPDGRPCTLSFSDRPSRIRKSPGPDRLRAARRRRAHRSEATFPVRSTRCRHGALGSDSIDSSDPCGFQHRPAVEWYRRE